MLSESTGIGLSTPVATEDKNATPRLRRSRHNRMAGGVCSGFGAYLGVDPAVVRLAWIALTITSLWLGFLLYAAAWAIIPVAKPWEVFDHVAGTSNARLFVGIGLISVGALILGTNFLPILFDFTSLAAAALVVLGGTLVARGSGARS